MRDPFKRGKCMANQGHLDIIKQGVEVWNQWRKEHSDIQPDLRGVDLPGADLNNADLTGADLRGTNLTGAFFLSADLSRAMLAGATFKKALPQYDYLPILFDFDPPDTRDITETVTQT